MSDLLRLLTLLADKKAPREKPGLMARAILAMIAGFFMMLALSCGLVALWIAAIPEVGPAGAPLVVGGVLLVLALVFFALSRKRRVVVVPPSTYREQQKAVEAESIFKEHKGALLLALFTAAFQSGVSRR